MNATRLIGFYLMFCGVIGFLVSFIALPYAQIILLPYFLFFRLISVGVANAYGGNIFTDWLMKFLADMVGRFFAFLICFFLGYLLVRFSEPKVVVMKR
jgi:hypothetical protein